MNKAAITPFAAYGQGLVANTSLLMMHAVRDRDILDYLNAVLDFRRLLTSSTSCLLIETRFDLHVCYLHDQSV